MAVQRCLLLVVILLSCLEQSLTLHDQDLAADAAKLELGALRARMHLDEWSSQHQRQLEAPGTPAGKAKNAQDVIDAISKLPLKNAAPLTLKEVQEQRAKATEEMKQLREKNAKMINDLDTLNVKHSALSEDVETSVDKMRSLSAKVGLLGTETSKTAKQEELVSLQKQYGDLSNSADTLYNQYMQLKTLRGAVYARMRKLHNEIVPLQSKANAELRRSLDVPAASNYEPRNPSEKQAIDEVEDMLDDHSGHPGRRGGHRHRESRQISDDDDSDDEEEDDDDSDSRDGADYLGVDFDGKHRRHGKHEASRPIVMVGVPHSSLPPTAQANLAVGLGISQFGGLPAPASAGFGLVGGGPTFNPMYPLHAPGAAHPAVIPPGMPVPGTAFAGLLPKHHVLSLVHRLLVNLKLLYVYS